MDFTLNRKCRAKNYVSNASALTELHASQFYKCIALEDTCSYNNSINMHCKMFMWAHCVGNFTNRHANSLLPDDQKLEEEKEEIPFRRIV